MYDKEVKELQTLIDEATNIVFFGGAGAEHTLILEDEIVQTGLIEKIKEGENEEW